MAISSSLSTATRQILKGATQTDPLPDPTAAIQQRALSTAVARANLRQAGQMAAPVSSPLSAQNAPQRTLSTPVAPSPPGITSTPPVSVGATTTPLTANPSLPSANSTPAGMTDAIRQALTQRIAASQSAFAPQLNSALSAAGSAPDVKAAIPYADSLSPQGYATAEDNLRSGNTNYAQGLIGLAGALGNRFDTALNTQKDIYQSQIDQQQTAVQNARQAHLDAVAEAQQKVTNDYNQQLVQLQKDTLSRGLSQDQYTKQKDAIDQGLAQNQFKLSTLQNLPLDPFGDLMPSAKKILSSFGINPDTYQSTAIAPHVAAASGVSMNTPANNNVPVKVARKNGVNNAAAASPNPLLAGMPQANAADVNPATQGIFGTIVTATAAGKEVDPAALQVGKMTWLNDALQQPGATKAGVLAKYADLEAQAQKLGIQQKNQMDVQKATDQSLATQKQNMNIAYSSFNQDIEGAPKSLQASLAAAQDYLTIIHGVPATPDQATQWLASFNIGGGGKIMGMGPPTPTLSPTQVAGMKADVETRMRTISPELFQNQPAQPGNIAGGLPQAHAAAPTGPINPDGGNVNIGISQGPNNSIIVNTPDGARNFANQQDAQNALAEYIKTHPGILTH